MGVYGADTETAPFRKTVVESPVFGKTLMLDVHTSYRGLLVYLGQIKMYEGAH